MDRSDPSVVRERFEQLAADDVAAAQALLVGRSVVQPFDAAICAQQQEIEGSISGDAELDATMRQLTESACNDQVVTYTVGNGFEYDLQTTDSLISPFVGEVALDWYQHHAVVNAAGRALRDDITLPRQWRLSYAYQDGEWALTKVEEYTPEQPYWQDSALGQMLFILGVAPGEPTQ